ncbi:MAG TPA: hypothetical protein VL728_17535 [Cyclobacteriaceae bacterium]|jgi:hypothetical protein|nr:hypothetical protein [Cyclobacteriaceae bacterium]
MRPFTLFILVVSFLHSCKVGSKKEESIAPKLDSLKANAYQRLFSAESRLSDIEMAATDEEKYAFVKSYFPYLLNRGDSAFLESVFAVDFNNDGKKDFIYSGPGVLTTHSIVAITGDTARFSEQCLIIDMDKVDKKVRRLYTNSIISTGGPAVEGYSIYDINYDGGAVTFVKRFDCELIDRTPSPATYDAFNVESIEDSLIVRSEPAAVDAPWDYMLALPGNQLGKVPRGTQAIVAGSTKDTLNTVWYFALIKPGYKIHGYPYMNMTFDPKDGRHRVVWTRADGWKRK